VNPLKFIPICLIWLVAGSAKADQWLTVVTNIGNGVVQSSLAFTNDVYTVGAAGAGISGTADQFGFVYESVSGDTEIVARVDSLGNTDPCAKAGVMIRGGFGANAPHAAMVVTPGCGAQFLTRSVAGQSTAQSATRGVSAPQWVRLVREADYLTGYYSADGLRWRQGGTLTISMSTNVQVGLVVCSEEPGQATRATFSRVDFLDAVRRPSVAVYNWPAGIPQSDKYQVTITQGRQSQQTFVHISHPEDRLNQGTAAGRTLHWSTPGRTFSWANFSCWGPATIEVKKLYGSAATNVVLSPKSYGLEPVIVDGNTVSFSMDIPRHVSVNFEVPENRVSQLTNQILHGLMLFADPPELSSPSLGDPGVVEFNSSVDQSSASVLYLLPGKIYYGAGTLTSAGIFDTNSADGNLLMSPGQCLYVAGGAYGYLSHWQSVSNTAVIGRGVISGVKQVFGIGPPGHWQAFVISDCVEGPTLVDLPHHALGPGPNAVIRHAKVVNAWWVNQDGIRGGQNSLIEDCFLKCCDDNFYPGFNIRRCVIWPSWNGATVQLGWGGVNWSNTLMTDSDLINPEWDALGKNDGVLDAAALYWSDQSENHVFDDIRIEGSIAALINLNMTTNSIGSSPGYIRNVTFRNITLEQGQSVTRGPSRSRIYGIVAHGEPAYAEDFSFEDVQIEGEQLTVANASTHLDIDPATTTDIRFSAGNIQVSWALSGTQFTLGFKTLFDRQYRVEFKNHLSEASWQTLTGQIPGTGREYQISDSIEQSAGSRFYRVARLP
jgi:hypothetical protein